MARFLKSAHPAAEWPAARCCCLFTGTHRYISAAPIMQQEEIAVREVQLRIACQSVDSLHEDIL